MRKIFFVLFLAAPAVLPVKLASATPANVKWFSRDHQAIKRAIIVDLNQFFGSRHNFSRLGRKGDRHSFSIIDVEGKWAWAVVSPRRQIPPEEFIPDGIGILLKKQKGRWKVLSMGTGMHGDGEKFGVPQRLWQKWLI